MEDLKSSRNEKDDGDDNEDDDDDDGDDDDDEIIIIENPNPKPKPPVIVLCDSDDDDEEQEQEEKGVISPEESIDNTVVVDIILDADDVDNHILSNNTSSPITRPVQSNIIDPLPDYIPLEMSNSDDSSTLSKSMTNDNSSKGKGLIRDWYKKYKTKSSGSSSQKSTYTCPECRAELSSVKMLDKHIQSRHPGSVHRHQQNTSPEHRNNSCSQRAIGTALQQRLKLNPLRSSISNDSMSTCTLDAVSNKLNKDSQETCKLVALPPLHNKGTVNQDVKSRPDTNKNFQPSNVVSGREKNNCASVSTSNTINTNSQGTCKIATLPPLINRRTLNQDIKSITSNDSNNRNCRPLTVVIYSPNSERGENSRYVLISPQTTEKKNMKKDEIAINNADYLNKKNDVIEILDSPCRDPAAVNAINNIKRTKTKTSCKASRKRKRQDRQEVLTDDDNDKQDLINRPAKTKKNDFDKPTETHIKKTYSCDVHRKTFATLKALLQHKQDKHSDNGSSNKCRKGKYCLRSMNGLNVRPFPSSSPPSMDRLKTMKHIVMIDIDNWQKIFESDLTFSPSTFVWGFHGGSTMWRPPKSSSLFKNLQLMNCFYLHPKCGRSKDAADFALCVQAGKLDVLLPKDIIFTVLSGDTGFNELQNQLSLSKREVHIVNPHHKTTDTVLTILNSIAEK